VCHQPIGPNRSEQRSHWLIESPVSPAGIEVYTVYAWQNKPLRSKTSGIAADLAADLAADRAGASPPLPLRVPPPGSAAT
jgi:hypothetical protein